MDNLLSCLKALSDETRFRLFTMLLESDCCVGALARQLGVTEANISQHLQILRKAGLVVGEKRGYWTHYSVVREKLIEMASALGEMAEKDNRESLQCPRTAGKAFRVEKASFCGGCCILNDRESSRQEA